MFTKKAKSPQREEYTSPVEFRLKHGTWDQLGPGGRCTISLVRGDGLELLASKRFEWDEFYNMTSGGVQRELFRMWLGSD